MTAPGVNGSGPARPEGQPAPFGSTPNAERYLLEADNLRRRQLRSALLHGSSRTWRDRGRIWPPVVAGIVVVAVISAAIAVYGAFQAQQHRQEAERQEREQLQQGLPALPAASADGPVAVATITAGAGPAVLTIRWGPGRSAASS